MDPATKKPNMTVDFSFSRKLPEGGEKFFNRTEPEELSASTLPPTLDFSAGPQPAARQPAGAARQLPGGTTTISRSEMVDKVSGKTVSRDVTFTVAPSAVQ